LKKTLYRASPKILGSSMAEEEAVVDTEDDYVPVTGTDGHMKDMGGGKFVVVENSMDVELSGVNKKLKAIGDEVISPHAEKRVCTAEDSRNVAKEATETVDQAEKRALAGVDVETAETTGGGGMKPLGVGEPATSPLESSLKVVETTESANGKRKAEEGEDRSGKKVCI
jgi:hypothetical protein